MPQKHLLHVFPTFAVGGSQMRFAQLARLHGERYRHTVIALDGKTDMMARLSGLPVTCQELHFDKRKPLQTWRQFRAALYAIRPDVLFTYNWGAVEWALINRLDGIAPHIHIEDGFGPEEASRQLKRRIWARRLALSGTNTTVVLPSRNLERIALNIWALSPQRVRFISNGIDCPRFAVVARGRSDGRIVIGTVASLRREKNIARLIQAFAQIASDRAPGTAELLIVGDGAERQGLEQLARELNIASQVRFAGQSDRPEDWYPLMDIFALSSDTEQMPLSVLEAMAGGLPVVATAVGDVAQMVAAENRDYVVPVQDFAAALGRLAADVAARRGIGLANEKKARESFDENVMATSYAALIG
ncbi:MAG TPA: glycosyltransferase [Rhizomicrobium sp.]|nr:glycosyltransferase [Rhizomicrobium sp.]